MVKRLREGNERDKTEIKKLQGELQGNEGGESMDEVCRLDDFIDLSGK